MFLFSRNMENKKSAQLILEDGSVYPGWAFGSETSTSGEVGEFQTCRLVDVLNIILMTQ